MAEDQTQVTVNFSVTDASGSAESSCNVEEIIIPEKVNNTFLAPAFSRERRDSGCSNYSAEIVFEKIKRDGSFEGAVDSTDGASTGDEHQPCHERENCHDGVKCQKEKSKKEKKTRKTSSSSSSSSDSEDEKKRNNNKRKKKQEKRRIRKTESNVILGQNILFCQIESFEGKKANRHYVITPREPDIDGDTGIRANDELLKLNGRKLESKRLHEVLDAFKSVQPVSGGEYIFTLTVRRWETRCTECDPKQYAVFKVSLKLKLTPLNDGFEKSEVLEKDEGPKHNLPKGNVENIQMKKPAVERVMQWHGGRSMFLVAGPSGELLCARLKTITGGHEVFEMLAFAGEEETPKAPVMEVFGKIISFTEESGQVKYLKVVSQNDQLKLGFHYGGAIDPTEPDERFFLIHMSGNFTFLESLLFRGNCIHYNNRFELKMFSQDQIYDQSGTEEIFSGCLFNIAPPGKDKVSPGSTSCEKMFFSSLSDEEFVGGEGVGHSDTEKGASVILKDPVAEDHKYGNTMTPKVDLVSPGSSGYENKFSRSLLNEEFDDGEGTDHSATKKDTSAISKNSVVEDDKDGSNHKLTNGIKHKTKKGKHGKRHNHRWYHSLGNLFACGRNSAS